jgi:hypothetical protein
MLILPSSACFRPMPLMTSCTHSTSTGARYREDYLLSLFCTDSLFDVPACSNTSGSALHRRPTMCCASASLPMLPYRQMRVVPPGSAAVRVGPSVFAVACLICGGLQRRSC